MSAACVRCGKRAAREGLYHWHPELCGSCAEEIKHPSMRSCVWVADEDRRRAANQMLAELRRFEIPAEWLGAAAEHAADGTEENVEDVLRRWAGDEP